MTLGHELEQTCRRTQSVSDVWSELEFEGRHNISQNAVGQNVHTGSQKLFSPASYNPDIFTVTCITMKKLFLRQTMSQFLSEGNPKTTTNQTQ